MKKSADCLAEISADPLMSSVLVTAWPPPQWPNWISHVVPSHTCNCDGCTSLHQFFLVNLDGGIPGLGRMIELWVMAELMDVFHHLCTRMGPPPCLATSLAPLSRSIWRASQPCSLNVAAMGMEST